MNEAITLAHGVVVLLDSGELEVAKIVAVQLMTRLLGLFVND